MDFLQIALILLIFIITTLLLIGGWMVFLILRDLRKSLLKLNEILYGTSVAASKARQSLVNNADKKSAKLPSKEIPRRFFKRI